MPGEDDAVRRMADLLRAGAAMLQERCPICGSPLFKLRSGEVVCPVHGRVYLVRSDEEAARITLKGVLEELEKAIVARLARLRRRVEDGGVDEAREIIAWLDALERIERVLSAPPPPRKEAEDKG
ncbi:MAG: Sjogren's syndrome/scleroderma autoantigen 1 family protein [Candidatus Korarchaeota archaeon]|nr:Sjogren's syndrome/scleroderma autoantigen 1 family protein [Candidatus Korarchaeota archaeon]